MLIGMGDSHSLFNCPSWTVEAAFLGLATLASLQGGSEKRYEFADVRLELSVTVGRAVEQSSGEGKWETPRN